MTFAKALGAAFVLTCPLAQANPPFPDGDMQGMQGLSPSMRGDMRTCLIGGPSCWTLLPKGYGPCLVSLETKTCDGSFAIQPIGHSPGVPSYPDLSGKKESDGPPIR